MNHPRLALVSDIVPEAAIASGLQLYRLLAEWPAGALVCFGSNLIPLPGPSARLPGVRYERVDYTIPRLHRTRLVRWVNLLQYFAAGLHAGRLQRRLEPFAPEVILTLSHGHLWLLAASLARRRRIPYFMLCHDALEMNVPVPRWADAIAGRAFRKAYRQAAERFCICPFMSGHYRAATGAAGVVLYPCSDDITLEPEPAGTLPRDGSPVVAYAGSLLIPGYQASLRKLCAILESIGGRLDLYGPHARQDLAGMGLDHRCVNLVGFVDRKEMARRLRGTAHALICPQSFLPQDQRSMRMLFPSKLADYLAFGIPVIIWGPETCSAVEWARVNPGAAVVVTDSEGGGVAQAIRRLASDSRFAAAITSGAAHARLRDFDPAAARRMLLASLCAHSPANGRAAAGSG